MQVILLLHVFFFLFFPWVVVAETSLPTLVSQPYVHEYFD